MTGVCRPVRVRAVAKINLDLRVLFRRPDGYHELRTIFQTISLADTLDIAFTPARRTSIVLDDPLALPDNLAARAARLVLERIGKHGEVAIRLRKRIPVGAGLGGGSSDAAAVLLALPVLAGRGLEPGALCELAGEIGSDVPFFLLGGTAAGIGRGGELFPLPDPPSRHGLLVAPAIHVSTAEAYGLLSSRLSAPDEKIHGFQSRAWTSGAAAGENDFEAVVFERHPRLKTLKKRLLGAGAASAMMTGSGSALFALFPDRIAAERAYDLLPGENRLRFSLVNRSRYRAQWRRALERYAEPGTWPPAPIRQSG